MICNRFLLVCYCVVIENTLFDFRLLKLLTAAVSFLGKFHRSPDFFKPAKFVFAQQLSFPKSHDFQRD